MSECFGQGPITEEYLEAYRVAMARRFLNAIERVVQQKPKEEHTVATQEKIWKDSAGKLYHDACFDEGESREGFTEMPLANLDAEDVCVTCAEPFLDDDDDDTHDDDDEALEPDEDDD